MALSDFLIRRRVSLGFVAGLAALILAEPASGTLLSAGMAISFLGVLLRLSAAGYLKKSKELTCSGPYAHIRSPLYLGSFVMGLGFCIASTSARFGVRSAVLWVFLLAFFGWIYSVRIRHEEEALANLFGEGWRSYAGAVPLFFARLTPFRGLPQWPFSWALVKKNKEFEALAGFLVCAAVLYFKWKRNVS